MWRNTDAWISEHGCNRSGPAQAPSSAIFFFNDTATTEIYTLSLHDALPICNLEGHPTPNIPWVKVATGSLGQGIAADRKSTRLNSSHSQISYPVFCLKKKKQASGPTGINTPSSGKDCQLALPPEALMCHRHH